MTHSLRRNRAFTLVELLTVIGIISLLISILLPSLSRARGQAKRVKCAAMIAAIEKGLEMFQNDFGQYPDSKERDDPITDYPGATAEDELFGAHWLARAMLGHDLQGIDTKGFALINEYQINVNPPGSGNISVVSSGGTGMTMADIMPKERKGIYIDGDLALRDNDPRLKADGGFEATGRLILVDAYQFPILYYRANSRARLPFSVHGEDGEPVGVYNGWDNGTITGGTSPDGPEIKYWDFAGTGQRHGLGYFGGDGTSPTLTATNVGQAPPVLTPPYKGKSFADYLHNSQAKGVGQVLKPQNPETFVLISAGQDGIYGTDDDVSNLKNGQ